MNTTSTLKDWIIAGLMCGLVGFVHVQADAAGGAPGAAGAGVSSGGAAGQAAGAGVAAGSAAVGQGGGSRGGSSCVRDMPKEASLPIQCPFLACCSRCRLIRFLLFG